MSGTSLKILLINLDRRADKLKICDYQLKQLSVADYIRISAVDGIWLGDEMSKNPSKSVGEIVNDRSIVATRDNVSENLKMAVGCTLSHLKALKYIVDHNINGPVLILEDDFVADGQALKKTEKFLSKLPADWGLFYAGHCHGPTHFTDIVEDGYHVGLLDDQLVPCAHAYVVNGVTAAKKLFDSGNTARLELADFFAQKAPVKRHIIYPFLFSQLKEVQADIESLGGNWYTLQDDSLRQEVLEKFLKGKRRLVDVVHSEVRCNCQRKS